MSVLSERIRTARLTSGWSQMELAERIGVSQPTVANWEQGSHIPRQSALKKIAQVLETDVPWLMGAALSSGTQAAQTYLDYPIRHVRIVTWPKNDGHTKNSQSFDFNSQPALGYVSLSTDITAPIAVRLETHLGLDMQSTDFALGDILLLDTSVAHIDEPGLYLVHDGQSIALCDTRLTPNGVDFPRVLARIRQSIRHF